MLHLIDRELSEVVSQDVLRVHTIHPNVALGVNSAIAADSLRVTQQAVTHSAGMRSGDLGWRVAGWQQHIDKGRRAVSLLVQASTWTSARFLKKIDMSASTADINPISYALELPMPHSRSLGLIAGLFVLLLCLFGCSGTSDERAGPIEILAPPVVPAPHPVDPPAPSGDQPGSSATATGRAPAAVGVRSTNGLGPETLDCAGHEDCVIIPGDCQRPTVINRTSQEAAERAFRRSANVISCPGNIRVNVGDVTAACLRGVCAKLAAPPEEHVCAVDKDCFLAVGICDQTTGLAVSFRDRFAAHIKQQSHGVRCGSSAPPVPVAAACQQALCVPVY